MFIGPEYRERAIATLRELLRRVEGGEGMTEANISVELIYDDLPKYLYATKITDNLDVNMPKASHYQITVRAAFPRDNNDAE